jgi:hypothetical protein
MNTTETQDLKASAVAKFQQGDVKFYQIKKIPVPGNRLDDYKDPVLVYGATGHHHKATGTQENAFKAFKEKDTQGDLYFLEVESPIRITHEEHQDVQLPVGTYFVDRVVEKGMFDDMINPVAD